jgi:hypothetical protein
MVYWRSALLGPNSRFGGFNSRLGRCKFPFGTLREFARNGLICLAVFSAKTALTGQNRKNFRFYGKNRESCYGDSFDMMIVPEAENMPPTPWQTKIRTPGIAGSRGRAATRINAPPPAVTRQHCNKRPREKR